jgi:hypothetical protein
MTLASTRTTAFSGMRHSASYEPKELRPAYELRYLLRLGHWLACVGRRRSTALYTFLILAMDMTGKRHGLLALPLTCSQTATAVHVLDITLCRATEHYTYWALVSARK